MAEAWEEEEDSALAEEEEAQTPKQDGFDMEDALAEFELAQVKEAEEQHAMLESS